MAAFAMVQAEKMTGFGVQSDGCLGLVLDC